MISKPNEELASFLSFMCMELGLNTACDYDGVESDEDVVIYRNAVIRTVRQMKQKLTELGADKGFIWT